MLGERPLPICVGLAMTCAATHVYVLLGRDNHCASMLHQMEETSPGRWGLTLRLAPGTYRYRYFANKGDVMTYVPPDEAEDGPVRMSAADAVLQVRAASKPGIEMEFSTIDPALRRGEFAAFDI